LYLNLSLESHEILEEYSNKCFIILLSYLHADRVFTPIFKYKCHKKYDYWNWKYNDFYL